VAKSLSEFLRRQHLLGHSAGDRVATKKVALVNGGVFRRTSSRVLNHPQITPGLLEFLAFKSQPNIWTVIAGHLQPNTAPQRKLFRPTSLAGMPLRQTYLQIDRFISNFGMQAIAHPFADARFALGPDFPV